MKGHFAFASNYLICGGCGSSMSPYIPPTPIDNEYTYRVYCCNPECPNYLEVYEPSDKIKVALIPTRLRAADPSIVREQQAQAQVRAVREAGRPATPEELWARAGTGIGAAGVAGGPTAPPTPLNPEDVWRADTPWRQFTLNQTPRPLTRDEVVNAARTIVETENAPRPR